MPDVCCCVDQRGWIQIYCSKRVSASLPVTSMLLCGTVKCHLLCSAHLFQGHHFCFHFPVASVAVFTRILGLFPLWAFSEVLLLIIMWHLYSMHCVCNALQLNPDFVLVL